MSFIKKLIYNGQYPLWGTNKPDVCSFIKDITIIYSYASRAPILAQSYRVRCTDIILSKEYCLFSCAGSDGRIFSANISNPVVNTVYPVYSDKVYCGSISFSRIPELSVSGINMSNVFVNDSCILATASGDVESTLSSNNIIVTGSLKTTIEADTEKTTVYIYPDEELFSEAASNLNTSLGEDYGITSINGVKPDDKGLIKLKLTNYISQYTPDLNQLVYTTPTPVAKLCSNKPSVFSKIRCSASDGEVIAYPLDEFACKDTEHITCTPEWDK